MTADIWALIVYGTVVVILIVILRFLLLPELPKYPYKVKEMVNNRHMSLLTVKTKGSDSVVVYRNVNLVDVVESVEKSLDYLLPIQERIIDFAVVKQKGKLLFIVLRDIKNSDRQFIYNLFTNLNYPVYWISKETANSSEQLVQFVRNKILNPEPVSNK